MNLQQAIERKDLASWFWIYALKVDGKFTANSKVVDETEFGAEFFASKAFADQLEGDTLRKIERINQLDTLEPDDFKHDFS